MPTKSQKGSGPMQIILIGAPAAGVEALQLFLRNYPTHLKKSCIVVALHNSVSNKSRLVELLSKETWLDVCEAVDNASLLPGKLYVAAANKHISLEYNKIKLLKPKSTSGPVPSIDILFNSVSQKDADSLVGIILSGTGSDGAEGIKHLQTQGALLLAEEHNGTEFDSMAPFANGTDIIKMIMPAVNMGNTVYEYINHSKKHKNKLSVLSFQSPAISKIFKLLGKQKGTDFSYYKHTTIGRRLHKRLESLNIATIEDYLIYLESNPSELDQLFSNLLINVTNFFRDKAAFKSLEDTIEQLIARKADDTPIRIWVVACATGEEAYSIAMILQHKMELLQKNYHVQIFATDLSESSIKEARTGSYSAKSWLDIPANYRNKYFILKGKKYELQKDVRAMVIFSKHDVNTSPPFLKIDLISCRNLLIYFNEFLHEKIFHLFHYALVPDGFLFLGKAESIRKFTDLFGAVDEKNRIYTRKQIKGSNPVQFLLQGPTNRGQTSKKELTDPLKPLTVQDLVKETLYKTYEYPFVVINALYNIQEISGDVRLFLSMPQGAANMNLFKLINKDLFPELRVAVSKCMKQQIPIKSGFKKMNFFDKPYIVRLQVKPLTAEWHNEKLYLVIFEEIQEEDFDFSKKTMLQLAANDLTQVDSERQLIAVREELGVYIEELEQTSEKLQSLNEELHSSNEELQTTNEELETTNEELQSTNEEVQITYNDLKVALHELEQKEKIIELSEANLHALLNNTTQCFFLVDRQYKIITYNNTAAETIQFLCNHQTAEGDSFVDFIPRTQLAQFFDDFSKALAGKPAIGTFLFETVSQEKRCYSYNFTPAIRKTGDIPAISIGLLDITTEKVLSESLATKDKMVTAVFNATSIGIVVTNELGIIEDINSAFSLIYGYSKDELIGNSFSMLMIASNRERALQKHISFINGDTNEMGAEWETQKKDGSQLFIYSSAVRLLQDDGRRYKVESVRNITEDVNINRLIHVSNLKYRAIVEHTLQPFFLTTEEGKILEFNKAALALFGYAAEELRKMYIGQLMMRTAVASPDELIQYLNEGNTTGELTGIKLNHQQFVCEFSSVKFNDENGLVRRSIMVNDISIRKAQELQMDELLFKTRASTSMLENLFSSINDGFAAIDGNWNFIYVNKMVRGFLNGSSKENLLGKNIWEEFPHLVGTPIYTNFITVMRTRKAAIVEHYSSSEKKYYENKIYPLMEDGVTVLLSDVTEQKTTEAALKHSKNEMALILNNTEEIFVVLDEQHKVVTYNSEAEKGAELVFGTKLKKGYNFLEVVTEERRPMYFNIVASVLEGKKISYSHSVTDIHGQLKVYQLIYSALNIDQSGLQFFMITARDITKEENAHAEIVKSQQLLNQAESIAKVGSWELDVRNDNLYWSEGMFNICGLLPGEIELSIETGITVVHEDDRADFIADIEYAIQEGKEFVSNKRFVRKDGSIRQIILHGQSIKNELNETIKLIGVLHDVTELRGIEKNLAISQQEYQSLFDQNPEAVVSLDLKGEFNTINKAAAQLFNCTKEQLVKASLSTLVEENEIARLQTHFRNARRGEAQNFETEIHAFDHQLKKVNITLIPIVINNDITGVYGMIKDITLKKLADIELASLYKQLEERAAELEKSNEELEQFAYVASHDLQEPLRMVTSFLRLLEKKYVNAIDEKGREYIHYAVDGSLRMKSLIQDLLDYSRIATNKQSLSTTDMNEVVREVLQNLSIQIDEQEAQIEVGVLPVVDAADKLQMLQLFQNLISNSIKYSIKGECSIVISGEERATHWLFNVKDSGIGFDPTYAQKIFVIFHRLHGKGTYSGTGIGLAICKKIVERHGGNITADSTPGVGSIFSFTINKNLFREL